MNAQVTVILCSMICAVMYGTEYVRADPPGLEIIVEGTWPELEGGNGHTYLGVKMARGLTWDEAKVVAEDLGGHLATLTSGPENDWVYANIASEACLWNAEAGPYIGGFQNHDSEDYSEPGGGWEWVTGEPWGYENWDPAQPDNAPPGEDLLHLWNPSAAQCPTCDATPPCGPNNAWNDIYPIDSWLDTLIVEIPTILLDIKPGSCPNSFNRNSHGVLPVALVGTGSFDVMEVDLASILLSRADGVGGSVAPNEGPPGPHSTFADVATPFEGPGAPGCDCHELEGDGILDLSMKFRTDDVVSALLLNDLPAGELVELVVSGTLLDGTAFSASDCIRLVPPGTPDGLLAVGSNLPGAWLDVSPLDIQLDGGGFANFERSFPLTSVVTVTAALTHQGWVFAGWRVGDLTGSGPGGALQLGQSIDITIGGEQQTAEAMYIPGFVGVRIIP